MDPDAVVDPLLLALPWWGVAAVLALGRDLALSCCLLRISCVLSLGLSMEDTEVRAMA